MLELRGQPTHRADKAVLKPWLEDPKFLAKLERIATKKLSQRLISPSCAIVDVAFSKFVHSEAHHLVFACLGIAPLFSNKV